MNNLKEKRKIENKNKDFFIRNAQYEIFCVFLHFIKLELS